MSGYEPSRFLQTYLPKDCLCQVCTYIMKDPVICSKCKYSCCQQCNKKGPLTCNHSFSVNGPLRTKINEISIKCKHWTKGCMEIVRIRDLEKHENSECYFSNYLCNRKDCEEITLPGKIKHMPECPYFLIECEVCKKSMKQSDKESHRCVEWLNKLVENLSTKISILQKENKDLSQKNTNLNDALSVKGPELDGQISELKEKNDNLVKETEAFKVSTQSEIQSLQERGVDKMKVFHENAETRLKSLWNRSQFDYEHLAKRLTDHMKTYLDNVNNLLGEFATKCENEELSFENENSKLNGEKTKINENGDSVVKLVKNEEKPKKRVNASGNKNYNNKSPVAEK